MTTTIVKVDALPLTINELTNQAEHKLDPVLKKLTLNDFRSIFFLLIDKQISKEDFLVYVKKNIEFLKREFIKMYYKFYFRDAFLIELFGTLQKYNLLRHLKTCRHVFEKDKDTFTQLTSLWKFLYSVCDQLEDGEVDYLKDKLFHGENLNICCAEELICLVFLRNKLTENNWKNTLADVFKTSHPDCSKLIISYKGSHLNYYPLRRPTKTNPCGIAVIMNHVNFDESKYDTRLESHSDTRALQKLWESFGFKTSIHTDLTADEVYQVFEQLSKENHSDHDVFVACYLSHGDEGVVVAKDGKAINLTTLVDIIANQCVTLVGKPKLFFVQACQGRAIQSGFGNPTHVFNTEPETLVQATRHSKNVALRSDVLLFNSSIEGFVSFRDGSSSWFIQALVSNMEKFGDEITVANVLTKVGNTVTEKKGEMKNSIFTNVKQTPVRYNTLKYELQLKKVL